MTEQDGWETVDTRNGTFRQRWVGCEPPGPIGSGVIYTVTSEKWNADLTERTIYAYELAADQTSDNWVEPGAHELSVRATREQRGTPQGEQP